MDDMLKFLAARIEEDRRHAASAHGCAAFLDSHLRVLDSIERLADDFRGFPDPWDGRTDGLMYALRVLARTYAAHPDYRAEEWHP
ncbi:DUF6221 family protein [Streptomyces sp. NPDC057582]|uniref:DUF6221 family protein n=1 Tax=Streptomyces sp. NPDC057582 TaxID=3346174 RepID=UPI003691012B